MHYAHGEFLEQVKEKSNTSPLHFIRELDLLFNIALIKLGVDDDTRKTIRQNFQYHLRQGQINLYGPLGVPEDVELDSTQEFNSIKPEYFEPLFDPTQTDDIVDALVEISNEEWESFLQQKK